MLQAVHGWSSTYERFVKSQKFFSSYLTQEDLVRLGRALEGGRDTVPVRDATTMHQNTDRKLRQKERQKKIAMGHKPDDHEDEIDLTLKGY